MTPTPPVITELVAGFGELARTVEDVATACARSVPRSEHDRLVARLDTLERERAISEVKAQLRIEEIQRVLTASQAENRILEARAERVLGLAEEEIGRSMVERAGKGISFHAYGHCPRCGAPGRTRERRRDGNDICCNKHVYPSNSSIACECPPGTRPHKSQRTVGNPNHGTDGRFAAAPGGSGGHAKERRRKRKAKTLERLRREYKAEAKNLKADHRGERTSLLKAQRRDHATALKQHAAERAKHKRGEIREFKSIAKEHRKDREKANRDHLKAVALEKQTHADNKSRINDDDEMKDEHDRHREELESLHESHAEEREALRQDLRGNFRDKREEFHDERKRLKVEQKDEHKYLKEGHQGDREEMKERHKEERQDLIDSLRYQMHNKGFKHHAGQDLSEPRPVDEPARRKVKRDLDDAGVERAGKHAGNPNHVESGPKGGQFASGHGGGGDGHEKPPVGRKKRPKRKVRKPGHVDKPAATAGDKKPANSKPKSERPAKDSKPKPTRGEMASARREGAGKDAKIVMSDGRPAPDHVKPSMVPPNWTDVKVSVDPKAEVLVTARDAKGRPKMVTSDSYDARSAAVKFGRVSEMIREHDTIGKQIDKARKDPATKEEADVAWLMREQGTRPGSDRDTKAKVRAYGATTLEARHVIEAPDGVRLQFIGKEGIAHDHLIRNPELGKMLVQRKKDAASPDAKIFATDDKKVRDFTATLDGGKFSPKDFRTSVATRMAIDHVKADPHPSKDEKEHKKRVMDVATRVSKLLGNRPAQALQSYIHPTAFNSWSPRS
jgi:DNA topoisomerase I